MVSRLGSIGGGYSLMPEGPLGYPKVLKFHVEGAETLCSTKLKTYQKSLELLFTAEQKVAHDAKLLEEAKQAYSEKMLAGYLYDLDRVFDLDRSELEFCFLNGCISIAEDFSQFIGTLAQSGSQTPLTQAKLPLFLCHLARQVAVNERRVQQLGKHLEGLSDAAMRDEDALLRQEQLALKLASERDERLRLHQEKKVVREAAEAEQQRVLEAAAVVRRAEAERRAQLERYAREAKAMAKSENEKTQERIKQQSLELRAQRAQAKFQAVQANEKAAKELSAKNKFAKALLAKAASAPQYSQPVRTPPVPVGDQVKGSEGSADRVRYWGLGLFDYSMVHSFEEELVWKECRKEERLERLAWAIGQDPYLETFLLDPKLLSLERQALDDYENIVTMEYEAALRIGGGFSLGKLDAQDAAAARLREEARMPDPEPSAPPASFLPLVLDPASEGQSLLRFFEAANLAYELDEFAEVVIPSEVISAATDGAVEPPPGEPRSCQVPVSMLTQVRKRSPFQGEGPRHKVGNFSRRKREAIKVALSKASGARERSDMYAGMVGDTVDPEALAELIDVIREQEEEDRREDEHEREVGVSLEEMLVEDECELLNLMDSRGGGLHQNAVLFGNTLLNPEGPGLVTESSPIFAHFCALVKKSAKDQNVRCVRIFGRTVDPTDPTSLSSAFASLTKVARKAKAPVRLAVASRRPPTVCDAVAHGIGDAIVMRSLAGKSQVVVPRDSVLRTLVKNDINPIKIAPVEVAPEAPLTPIQVLEVFLSYASKEVPSEGPHPTEEEVKNRVLDRMARWASSGQSIDEFMAEENERVLVSFKKEERLSIRKAKAAAKKEKKQVAKLAPVAGKPLVEVGSFPLPAPPVPVAAPSPELETLRARLAETELQLGRKEGEFFFGDKHSISYVALATGERILAPGWKFDASGTPLASGCPVYCYVRKNPAGQLRAVGLKSILVPQGPGLSKMAHKVSPCVLKLDPKDPNAAWNAPLVAVRPVGQNLVLSFVLPLTYHKTKVHYEGIGPDPVPCTVILPSSEVLEGKAFMAEGLGEWQQLATVDFVTEGDIEKFNKFLIPNARCTAEPGDVVVIEVFDKTKLKSTSSVSKVTVVTAGEIRHDSGVEWLDGTSDGVCGSLAYVNTSVASGRQLRLYGIHAAAGGGINVAIKLPTNYPPLHRGLK